MKKKLLALALAALMILGLAACGEKEEEGAAQPNVQDEQQPVAGGEVTGLSEAFAEAPILLTSGGQSADYQMIGTVMGKLEMDYEMNNLATSADLGDAKTLVVVVGGSSKGLGAAGIDADGEIARLDELISAAKEQGLAVIAMHTGGSARRGELSDKFIAPVFDYADYAIVVAAGDEDGKLSGICADKGIPMDSIDSISAVTTVLPAAFK